MTQTVTCDIRADESFCVPADTFNEAQQATAQEIFKLNLKPLWKTIQKRRAKDGTPLISIVYHCRPVRLDG